MTRRLGKLLIGADTSKSRSVDEPGAFFVLMSESIGPAQHVRHAFADIGARWHRALTAQITKGQKSGHIRRDADARIEAQLLIAAVRGLRLQSMPSPGEGSIADAITALKRDLRRRLALRAA